MAGIDVGAQAIDRASSIGGYTLIGLDNPANSTGTLSTVEVWANTNITSLIVGTFYLVSGTTYKCRASQNIGDIIGGAKRTVPVSIAVVIGDLLGCFWANAAEEIEWDTSGYAGVFYRAGEYIDPGDEVAYFTSADDAISLYGYTDGLSISVDWNNDGDYIDANDQISDDTKSYFCELGRDTDLDKAMIGVAGITVKDSTGKYIPENSSGPLYGSLLPGRPVQISRVYNGIEYQLFNGFLDDVLPDPSRYANEAYLPCVDGLDQLQRIPINTSAHENEYSGDMMDVALDAAGWSTAKRVIDTGQEEYPAIYANDISCLDFVQNVEASEFGFAYVGSSGYFHWEDRTHRLTTGHTTSVWVCDETMFRDIKPTYSLKSVRNRISITAQPKFKAASTSDVTDIWTLQENATNSESPVILAGETKTYWGKYVDGNGINNIAGNVVAPESTTDYDGNNAVDGSGASRTTDITVTPTVYAGTAKLEVTNGGATDLYLTMLKIRGNMYTDQPQTKIVADSTASQDKYQLRERTINLPYYQSVVTMENATKYRLGIEKEPPAGYIVELVNADSTTFTQMLSRHVSDRITLQDSRYVIDNDFYIDKIRHEWSLPDKVHHTWWTLSKADDQMYWVWDVSVWGASSSEAGTTRWAY